MERVQQPVQIPKAVYIKYTKILDALKVTDIIIENNSYNEYYYRLFSIMRNENMFMIVIENMAIAVIMNKDTAMQFGYIKDLALKYGTAKKIFNYKINIFTITEEWDTSKWSLKRLQGFTFMMHEIDRYTLQQIKNKIKKDADCKYLYSRIDIHFLEALSWESPFQTDPQQIEQTDVSGNSISISNEPEPMPYYYPNN